MVSISADQRFSTSGAERPGSDCNAVQLGASAKVERRTAALTVAYLVDSDWVIEFLADVPEAVELLERLADDDIAISIIIYMEVYEGVRRSARAREVERKLDAFLTTVPLLPFSTAVARRCARLRAELRRQGKRVNARALDLLIAATALEHNLTLVTRNVKDYADIPGIRLYNN